MAASPDKRTKIIKVRVNEVELAALESRKTRPRLAEWMRDACLSAGQADWIQSELDRQASEIPTADPELVRALAGIGNNVNQIARRVHEGAADSVTLLAELSSISETLAGIREDHQARGPSE